MMLSRRRLPAVIYFAAATASFHIAHCLLVCYAIYDWRWFLPLRF